MLMKTRPEPVDFFHVESRHQAIHMELENWARYVGVRRMGWVHPMWKGAQSNGRQWHAPEVRDEIRPLDAMEMEKAVFKLPQKHREAIRWCYVYKWTPAIEARRLAVTYERLAELVREGRVMLVNRQK